MKIAGSDYKTLRDAIHAAALVSALAEALDNALVHHGARMPAEDVRTRSALVAEARGVRVRRGHSARHAGATRHARRLRGRMVVRPGVRRSRAGRLAGDLRRAPLRGA